MLRRRPAPVVSRKVAATFAFFVALALFPLLAPTPGLGGGIEPGDVAPRDLVARRDVQYESEVQLEAARAAAAAAVPEVRVPDSEVQAEQLRRHDELFAEIGRVRAQTDLSPDEKVALLEQSEPVSVLPQPVLADLVTLSESELASVEDLSREGLEAILNVPTTAAQIPGAIEAYLDGAGIPRNEPTRATARGILDQLVVENFVVDEELTAQHREEARANVTPATTTWAQGQTIVSEGEVITAVQIEALREAGVVDTLRDHLGDWAAGAIFAIGAGAVLGMFLYLLQPVAGRVQRRLIVVGVVSVAALAVARIAFPQVLPDDESRYLAFALPLPAAAILAASLLELNYAAVVAVVIGVLAAVIAATTPAITGASFDDPTQALQLALVYTFGGLIGAAAVHRADRFSRYGLAAFAVAASTAVVLGAWWLLGEQFDDRALGWIAVASAVNGIGSGILAIGVFVLLSNAFGVTTRLQLMELAQTDHPLLSRLQEEAPGTFQHSMMVGNLAERAARRIGADPLVTRVGAYYHDIGKLRQPEYYVENQLGEGGSPHDTLPPEDSARRIMEHVTNGITLARRHRLPAIITDFIPQHHGTRLVTYFYRQAVQAGLEVHAADFRYPGPRPQSKETAIVMLADSCEALIRSARDAEVNRIAELVDGIFAERLAEGQLDECDMTMRDLQVVAESFKETFRAIYHPRIAYPDPNPEELAALANPDSIPPPAR